MDHKEKEVIKVKELETRLKEIDKDLSNGYSIGKKLARNKIQEKIDHGRADLFFHS